MDKFRQNTFHQYVFLLSTSHSDATGKYIYKRYVILKIFQVIFEIRQLESINLDRTKINSLPDTCEAALLELCLENNFFRKVPQMIFTIGSLKRLDISNNHIADLPAAIGMLSNLEEFRCSSNSIIDVPAEIRNLKNLQILELAKNRIDNFRKELCDLPQLKRLILEDNQIALLPGEITKLSHLDTLDMTGNNIEALPVTFYKMKSLKMLHVYCKFQKHGLWLHRNPLKTPPHHIWKGDDIEKVYTFLRKLQIMRTENLQRQKMVVLGAHNSGKTR